MHWSRNSKRGRTEKTEKHTTIHKLFNEAEQLHKSKTEVSECKQEMPKSDNKAN